MNIETRHRLEKAIQLIAAGSQETAGCSTSDIERLHRRISFPLPDAYLYFFEAVGADAGDFLKGSEFLLHQLDDATAEAEALLEDDGDLRLPPNAFVFCSHHGYQFLFFILGDGPDPTVHYHLEAEGEFQRVADTFSEWLMETVRDERL